MKRPIAGAPLAYGAGLFAVSLGVFASLYLLWLGGHQETYLALVRLWGIDAWSRPFLDLTGVLSWGECHRLGYDVFRANPCDPLGRTANYGPLVTLLPFSVRDAAAIGIAQSLAFLAALPLVIRPRNGEEWAVALAAALSTATLFALERGNLDLIEFLLVAVAAAFTMRCRCAAYAVYYLGGMLKFYPFALLLQVLRERPKTAVAAALAAAAAIGLNLALIGPELKIITANLPAFSYDSDSFGAFVLPYGIAEELDLPAAFGPCAALALFAGFGAIALRLSGRLMRAGLPVDWTAVNSRLHLAGAIVMAGCFMTQTNLDYRAIFFLFMLPGFFDLRNAARTKYLKWCFRLSIWGVLFCMWGEFVRRALEHVWQPSTLATLVFFVGRELVWWGVMAVAAGAVATFVRTSPLAATLSRLRPAAR